MCRRCRRTSRSGARWVDRRCCVRARSRRQTSRPSMSGRLMSSTMRPMSCVRGRQRLGAGGRLDDLESAERRMRDVEYSDAGLSSTTTIFWLRDLTGVDALMRSPGDDVACSRMGSVTEKREPLPSSLSTATSPPSSSANLRASDRPRPVPRSRFCRRTSICTKSSNRLRQVFGRDADAGVRSPRIRRCSSGSSVAVTRTSPSGVNLSALEMKLRRICDSFLSSVYSLISPSGSSNTSDIDRTRDDGLEHAAQRREQVHHLEPLRARS